MFCKTKSAKKNKLFFCAAILEQKCSNQRPLLSITFPQGFRILKKYWTSDFWKGGKNTFRRYLKSEHTDGQTDGRTDRRTFRPIERIGPEGRCFERERNNTYE